MLLQTAGSFGHSGKSQPWPSAFLTGLVCAEGEHTQKVCQVYWHLRFEVKYMCLLTRQ
jgi:hypothetical protein